MGYIHTFGEKLDALLQRVGVADADRHEIIAYVKEAVLASYRNGLEQGGAQRRAPRNEKRRPDGRKYRR
jgi:hypothetical protein